MFLYFPASLLSCSFSSHLLWPGFPGSQAVTLRLNHITGFPGPLTSRQHIWGAPASMPSLGPTLNPGLWALCWAGQPPGRSALWSVC